MIFAVPSLQAQQIHFGTYSDYGIQITEVSSGDLDFGNVLRNEGIKNIDLADAKVFAITGVKYLDAIVDISIPTSQPQYLTLNGTTTSNVSEEIPFTLKAAYANLGQQNYGQARFININPDNSATVRFRIHGRGDQPPGPPPTPPHKGYTPPEDTAYLYIYGSINVGNVNAGTYTTTINISVTYDSGP